MKSLAIFYICFVAATTGVAEIITGIDTLLSSSSYVYFPNGEIMISALIVSSPPASYLTIESDSQRIKFDTVSTTFEDLDSINEGTQYSQNIPSLRLPVTAQFTYTIICSTYLGNYAKMQISPGGGRIICIWAYQTDGSRNVSTRTAVERRATVSSNDISIRPNPFNPRTTVIYGLKEPASVYIYVLDMKGEQIAVLESGKKSAGNHSVTWEAGARPGGVYLCHIKTDRGFTATRRMLLIK